MRFSNIRTRVLDAHGFLLSDRDVCMSQTTAWRGERAEKPISIRAGKEGRGGGMYYSMSVRR